MEDLCLLSEGVLPRDPLTEDLSQVLPLAPASVPEAVLVGVVLVLVWVAAPPAARGSRGGNTCCW